MADTGFTIPTLNAIVDRVQADIDSAIPGADSQLRRTALNALSLGVSGAAWLVYAFGGEVARETLPDCASAAGVARWQAMFGLADVTPARSVGSVDVSGVDGSTIAAGDGLVRNDGIEYVVTTGATIAAGVGVVIVEAVEPGTIGDAVAGSPLVLSVPLAGIDSDAVVAVGGITGGVDVESLEALRQRVLARMADPPQGGSDADFRQWTREAVANVRSVYVSGGEPFIGAVTVRFLVEPGDGDPANALPSPGQVQTALDYIAGTLANNFEDAAAPVPISKPITGPDAQPDGRIDVRLLAGQPVDLEITDLTPDTPAIRASVEDSVKALFLQRGQPGGSLKVSQIIGAIDAAPGEVSHVLTEIDGAPPADVAIGADSFPVLGTVVYV